MLEMHFWMMGVCYEPHYSYSRIMLTKLITLASLFDDFYDNYSTTEESKVFTAALERLAYLASSHHLEKKIISDELLSFKNYNINWHAI
jgi:hypothetical protein